MEQTLSLTAIQQQLFSVSSTRSSEELPLDIALDVVDENALALKDVLELKEKGLIAWDLHLKSQPFMGYLSNFDHLIQCVAYYGNAEKGRCCIGFALGCINPEGTAIELYYIEKRKDSGDDLCSKFLPIIVDAFSLYGLYLNSIDLAKINKFVIVGPLDSVVPYYKESGFEYVENYSEMKVDAMFKSITN
ncbi:hypothetical protein [Aliivibrio fischeri]|uniref:GNAT family N-acetyltransferase n=1 Tax=Aliivibrio fischeri TaxID=668 RepID=A0A844P6U0_ALIFS|nr:hypothetical protein [Aliivibrio fischeri]MUK51101.1 hypothetical protein [Aliivibrio fischeri]